MEIAQLTRYRKQVVDAIAWRLEEVDRVCGLPQVPIPRRISPLILAPKGPVPRSDEVRAYVEGVALSKSVSELEELVVRTESLELLRRFRRWVVGCDRARLDDAAAILEVTTG